ncbi:MAG TPA: hypothetical protein VF173_00760 [Thermoanaerobaculia bacterium]|nr:hypothetical protein [Thermoanaerobaculia bacterium]
MAVKTLTLQLDTTATLTYNVVAIWVQIVNFLLRAEEFLSDLFLLSEVPAQLSTDDPASRLFFVLP